MTIGFRDAKTDRTVGYALMAVSAWLLWRADKRGAKRSFISHFLPSP